MSVSKLCILLSALMFAIAALDAQNLLDQDLTYGLNLHNRITSANPVIDQSDAADRLKSVFAQLISTSIVRTGPVPSYQLFYIHSSAINAFSTAGGRMYVTDSFMNAVQGDPGVLAFAMGHEIGHLVNQHQIKKYLREQLYRATVFQLRRRIALGDKRANWELTGYVLGYKISESKMERNEEHQADQVGLLMSAEAGYHPAFSILAARTLQARVGDQSKFMAFFSDHPRWATREERVEEQYPEALAVYRAAWHDSDGPGGPPPLLVATGKITVSHHNHEFEIAEPISLRNIRKDVNVTFLEVSEHGEEPLTVFERHFDAGDASESLTAIIREADLKDRKGHQFVRVIVTQDGKVVYEAPLNKLR